MSGAVIWLRRDLRLGDNPALLEAASGPAPVALFVFDPALWDRSGRVRQVYLIRSLTALRDSLDGRLLIRYGNPVQVVPEVAAAAAADVVHIANDFGPYGIRRDDAVEQALQADGRELQRKGSAYAVAPGRVRKSDDTPYRVYTPFFRAWVEHGWLGPADLPDPSTKWRIERSGALATQDLPMEPVIDPTVLPPVGEGPAHAQWRAFCSAALADYADARNRPDLAGTSGLSAALHFGEIHPRTLLADLHSGSGPDVYRKELAWREFYADVLAQAPESVWAPLQANFAAIEVDEGPVADERFDAWSRGRTGYPFVDAGMRQLLAEGWMHNRVRMVTASFLVKDLHLPWQRGARWFMRHLRDGDLASNTHGWQWTAGCGTDAAPYYRVFNPVTQGQRFDPEGDYVRRYVPELRDLDGATAHEPWAHPAREYPERIVDHAVERVEALARYQAIHS